MDKLIYDILNVECISACVETAARTMRDCCYTAQANEDLQHSTIARSQKESKWYAC